ncbi:MAG: AsmA-like C-terminal region-containing protein [Gammaproteobacteria bacterium]
MQNIIKIFFNIIIILLFSFSALVFISENTSTFNQKLSNTIEREFLDNYNVISKIDSVKVKWEGINPNIHISKLKINDKKNNIILDTPISIFRIDLLQSLFQRSMNISEIIVNDTSIILTRDNSKISINNLSFMDEINKTGNTVIPKIILKNSTVKLNDKSINNTINFKINTLIVSSFNNLLTINANFFHKSSLDPITFIYHAKKEDDNNLSKVYLSGNSVKLPYDMLPASLKQIKSDRISFRVWMDLNNMKIEKLAGNITASQLDVKLPLRNLKIKNVNSDILYVKNKTLETLSLMRLNYLLNDKKINDNKIVVSKTKSKQIKVFIKKDSYQIIDVLSKKANLFNYDYLSKLKNPSIKNLQIHTSNKDILNYFSFTVDSPLFELNEQYQLNDISFDMHGDLKKGRMNINSVSMSNNMTNSIDKMNGSITYNIRGKSIYFSSNNLEDENGHRISISGKKISKYPSLKIELLSSVKEIKRTIYSGIEKDKLEISGSFNSNIYYHNNKIFAKTKIRNFYLNNFDSVYLSSDKIDLFHSSNMIKSNKFTLSLNNQNQTSSIDTNIKPKTYEYIMSSLGKIDTALLTKLSMIDNNIIKGKSLVKSKISYNKKNGEINLYASSDLEGVSIDIYQSSIKKPEEKLSTILNYQYSSSVSYPIKISVDKHNLEIKNESKYFYLKIKSPAARGFIKYPKALDKDEVLNGSFEYIDTSFFAGGNFLASLPKINIKAKYLKSNNLVFDNFNLIMIPMNEYIEITKLNFKNNHLEMTSSGKWFIKDKIRTELFADIKSDNFGLALKTLGYPDTIKGGKLQAELSGTWEGSIQDFGFSKTIGTLKFNIEKGQINELDKGTQALGQVLGLFSISSIPKRLSLDFSDFFSTGLSFDNLNTEIDLNSGIADTKKMTITGSFGEMRLSGKSDLINQTHNQVLIFIPDLSSTSLVTGAVIGGPIGAAASIFYDKLLKEFGVDTNKLAGIEYSIKGPWSDPEIKVTQSFKPIIN